MNNLDYNVGVIPKVSLHEHIEGSARFDLVKKMAMKNYRRSHTMDKSPYMRAKGYDYDKTDFNSFISTYNNISDVIKSNHDYFLVSYDFLKRSAENNMIYSEIIVSPSHMAGRDSADISPTCYAERLMSINYAVTEIQKEYDIRVKLIATGVRNHGVTNVNQIAKFVRQNPNSLVSGFGIAGNENESTYKQFACGFKAMKNMGLGLSLHAGELGNSQNIWDAIEMGANRIGHGIAAAKDEKLIKYLAQNNILLEICPTSNDNLVEGITLSNHPMRKLYESGVRVSINGDDSGIFDTNIGKEYAIAKDFFGFSRVELLDVSLCGIEAAFVDAKTRKSLLCTVTKHITDEDRASFKALASKTKNDILRQRLMQRATGKSYE